jgi:hypothetical protein
MKNKIDTVNVDEIISEIEMPEQYKDIYERFLIEGTNFMFSKDTHKLALRQLEEVKLPLAENLAEGCKNLTFWLVDRFNGMVPSMVVIPSAVVFVCKAFEYLQLTGHPQATKEVLGNAIQDVIESILQAAGHKTQDIPKLMEQYMSQLQEGFEDA